MEMPPAGVSAVAPASVETARANAPPKKMGDGR
jgi:hypothetical protein